MRKIVPKVESFLVDAADQTYSKKFTLDKNVKLVRGINISSNNPKLLYYRGSQRIELSGDELYPEEFESKMFMSGLNVPPDDKYKTLGDEGGGVIAGNGELKISYKDETNPSAPFSPYKVIINLECELA